MVEEGGRSTKAAAFRAGWRGRYADDDGFTRDSRQQHSRQSAQKDLRDKTGGLQEAIRRGWKMRSWPISPWRVDFSRASHYFIRRE